MVGRLLIKGMLAGAVAGLLIFFFLKTYGEPWIDRAIVFEEQAGAAASAAGAKEMPVEPELVSRQTQAGIGLLTGVMVYGAAVGGLFAIAFAFANGRLGPLGPRGTTILLAAIGLIAVILVPALKYPPNPPAVGSGDTIDARTQLYFTMMGISLLAGAASLITGRQLWTSIGGWAAVLLAGSAYAVTIALTFIALPSVNEVPEAFPADTLWNFRAVALAGHLLFWAMLAAAFAALNTKTQTTLADRYSAT
ncbi:membrane protein [Labrys miyagiensis]